MSTCCFFCLFFSVSFRQKSCLGPHLIQSTSFCLKFFKMQLIPKNLQFLEVGNFFFFQGGVHVAKLRALHGNSGIRVGWLSFFDNKIWYEPVHIEKVSKMNDSQSSPSPTRCIVVHPGGAIFLNLIFDPKFSNHFLSQIYVNQDPDTQNSDVLLL